MDEQLRFQAERNAALRRLAVENSEREEIARHEAQRSEGRAKYDALSEHCRVTGEPVPSVTDILARSRDAAEDVTGTRDMTAPYGSASRPVVYAIAADGSPIEMGGPVTVGRSVSRAVADEQLRQAEELAADGFMAVQIARFHRGRPGSAEAERAEMARRVQELGYSEITR